jgi:hypothetical protein
MEMITIANREMPIWILSIPDSPRRVDIAKYMGSLNIPYEFMDGILVSSFETALHDASLRLNIQLPTESSLPKGDLGCLLAYLYMCKRVVEEKIPWIMILEDDVRFHDKYEKVIKNMNLAEYICSDWTFIHPNMGFSTLGQIVTYVGAKKVLANASKIIAANQPIDLMLFSRELENFHYAVCYGTEFWLVDQNTPYNELEYSERLQINKQSE